MGVSDDECDVVEKIIMPWNRSLYPDNWEQIAHSVKQDALWHCEECGRPCRKPDESLNELRKRIGWNATLEEIYPTVEWVAYDKRVPRPTRFVLTVAHLDHNPENCDRSNLKALCSVCHLQYDNTTSSRFRKQQIKAERAGQLPLLV
ncbi:MAG: HNH endonuclease [Cyanobacteria bacterium J06634_6]